MLLLTIIYIAFIGLGLPDSLLGTAWPAIYQDFNLPFSYGSSISAIIYFGTMISSINSAKFIQKLGTFKVTVISTFLTVIALFGFSCANSYMFLCLCAIPLGLGAGCIDTALNNYVSLHYSSKHMNFMHCFYGIGVVASPWIISSILKITGNWRDGYTIATCIQIIILFIILFSASSWKKAQSSYSHFNDESHTEVLSFLQVFKTPGVLAVLALILGDSIIESLCNVMGATYLVEEKLFLPEIAAQMILFYYLGMVIGRFVSGLISEKLSVYQIIKLSMITLGFGIMMLFMINDKLFLTIALFLTGLGIGPLFPNITYLTPNLFGSEKSPSIIGAQMSMGSIALMLSPMLCSFIAEYLSMIVLPIIMLISLILIYIAYCTVKKMS